MTNRRLFLGGLAAGAAAWGAPASKRERMQQWLAGKTDPAYTPAAFFLHFAKEYKDGLPAARKHLEYFRQTDMDFVKVQFEQTYERQAFLQKPADWAKLGLRKLDWYEPVLITVRELVKAAKKDALIVMTLYSPYMCAGHCATSPVLKQHLEENPEAVKKGLEILTESQMLFVRACIREGVDGFYMSTQGGEAGQFKSPGVFEKYIQPFDLVAMKEAQARCGFNILHVCDYVAPYSGYEAFREYPGHVVNCNTRLTGKEMSLTDIGRFFNRPVMGGLDRHGILVKGGKAELDAEIRRLVAAAPKQFILGADCTVPSETDWSRLRAAIDLAHHTGRA